MENKLALLSSRVQTLLLEYLATLVPNIDKTKDTNNLKPLNIRIKFWGMHGEHTSDHIQINFPQNQVLCCEVFYL